MPPSRKELETGLVLMQYGRTMLAVQRWECALAYLWLLAGMPKRPKRAQGDGLRGAIRGGYEAFQRATAHDLRERLSDTLTPELLAEIERLTKWRNVLAHRYLRERLVRADDRRFKENSLTELAELAGAFDACAEKLEAQAQSHAETLPEVLDNAPEEVQAFVNALAEQLVRGSAVEPSLRMTLEGKQQ